MSFNRESNKQLNIFIIIKIESKIIKLLKLKAYDLFNIYIKRTIFFKFNSALANVAILIS